jgi:hypothetical protein
MVGPTIEVMDFWEGEGRSYRELAGLWGFHVVTVSRKAVEFGFRRRDRCEYREGPCVECGEVVEREELDDHYHCEECSAEVRPGQYHESRWGRRPQEPHDPDWLALERIASEFRMRDPTRERAFKRAKPYPLDHDEAP